MNTRCFDRLLAARGKASASDLHYLTMLIHAHGLNHKAEFSYLELAALWDCSDRHAKTTVSKLRAAGHVILEREGNGRNVYSLPSCGHIPGDTRVPGGDRTWDEAVNMTEAQKEAMMRTPLPMADKVWVGTVPGSVSMKQSLDALWPDVEEGEKPCVECGEPHGAFGCVDATLSSDSDPVALDDRTHTNVWIPGDDDL